MYIFVLPVSGGAFVSQLAILQHLSQVGYKPDLTLASSGGNVAAYVAMAAEWKWAAIERIARELTQDLFLSPLNPVSALAFIIGYFQGNIYGRGTGVHSLLNKYFNTDSIQKYEIWTGTYNKDRKKIQLFCNRRESILDVETIDPELTQSLAPIFNGGNISRIARSSVASASIPAIVPAEIINGERHVDGGVACASPLTIMQDPILDYVRRTNQSMHLIYINSIDISATNIKESKNMLDTWRQTTSDLIRAQTVIDRLSGFELLRCHPGKMFKKEFICNYENLQLIKNIQATVKYSMLEIYPSDNFNINIINFNGDDVAAGIHRIYDKCLCRFWWLDNEDSESEACHVLGQCK